MQAKDISTKIKLANHGKGCNDRTRIEKAWYFMFDPFSYQSIIFCLKPSPSNEHVECARSICLSQRSYTCTWYSDGLSLVGNNCFFGPTPTYAIFNAGYTAEHRSGYCTRTSSRSGIVIISLTPQVNTAINTIDGPRWARIIVIHLQLIRSIKRAKNAPKLTSPQCWPSFWGQKVGLE